MTTLIQDVRSQQNIFAAWRHVKRSALTSRDKGIRGAASEFEHAHQRHLHTIITQLREGRFEFEPAKGVLKDKKKRAAAGKDPRPIVIATLRSRIAQRAILQILQPRVAKDTKEQDVRYEASEDVRLGKINDVNRSRFGVGGLLYPYGGVQPAITTIRAAIDAGAKYFYKSDIKAFFTHIPTKVVADFVRAETKDDELSDLFEKALSVRLANEDEMAEFTRLFPKDGIGVAQGSALSAFAGNVLLYDMDHELNALGVTAVRYIDDLLMVAESETVLDRAISYAERALRFFDFDLYPPVSGSDKAAKGRCSDAIDFLGCSVQPHRCVPSNKTVSRFKEEITSILSASKRAIKKIGSSEDQIDPRLSRTGALDNISKKIYGWQKSFSFCTDEAPFRQFDEYVGAQIYNYEQTVERLLSRYDQPTRLVGIGIPSTQAIFLADKKRK